MMIEVEPNPEPMERKSIVLPCTNADDGGRHQTEPVPLHVVREYERSGRKHLCYLCKMKHISEQPGFSMTAEDHTTLYDSWGRLRDQQVNDV